MSKLKALVVGIDDYPPPNQLPSCVNDANAMLGLLRSNGYEVEQLLNAQATKAAVTDKLREMFENIEPDDRLVFYYSGHGYTDHKGNLMEEYLVLTDGLFNDDLLSELTQGVTPGALTIILDSCFSGGMEKMVFREEAGETVTEVAKVKAWQPSAEDLKKFNVEPLPQLGKSNKGKGEPIADKVQMRTFGLSDAATKQVIIRAMAEPSPMDVMSKSSGLTKGPGSDEVGQTQTNGLVISACLETETAAASTSMTDGKSAFTYAMLTAARELGGQQSTTAIFQRAADILKSLHFRQTPLVMAPAALPQLAASYSFLLLQQLGDGGIAPPTTMSASLPTGEADPMLVGAVLAALIPALVDLRLKYAQSVPQSHYIWPSFVTEQPGGVRAQPQVQGFRGTPNDLSQLLASLIPALVEAASQRPH